MIINFVELSQTLHKFYITSLIFSVLSIVNAVFSLRLGIVNGLQNESIS